MVLLILLEQWELVAIGGTLLIACLGTLAVLSFASLRASSRHSAKADKDVDRIRSRLTRIGERQNELYAFAKETRRELVTATTEIQAEIQRKVQADATILERISFAERRIVSALEGLRLEVDELPRPTDSEADISSLQKELKSVREELAAFNDSDVQAELNALGERLRRQTIDSNASTVTRLTAVARDETRQVEALLQLLPKVNARAPLPPSGRWAMDARALLHLNYICSQQKPRNILELGSGTSTVWLGYLLEDTGASITSVDHDERFARLTAESLARHGLATRVDIRTAPLEPVVVAGTTYRWYAPAALEDLREIDLLIVDGPPASEGSLARYPALPVLCERLAPTCTVVVDDSERRDETEALERWLDELPGFSRIDSGMSRLAVLTRSATER